MNVPGRIANSNPRNEKAYLRYHADLWPEVLKTISSGDRGLSPLV
jgi:L-rhamnose mutarotase